ncbi:MULTISPECIES: twin-arginine translocation signal domain-containing protein, partial [pseudomallei group]
MTTDLDLPDAVRASRRTFLKAAGAAAAVGLTIGFEWLDASRPALGATAPAAPA